MMPVCLYGCNSQESSIAAEPTIETSPNNEIAFAAWGHGDPDRSSNDWMELLEKYKEQGITDLFLQAKPDELRRLSALCKEAGVKLHGWVWTLNRPGDSIAMEHPEWYAVNRNGENSLDYRAYVDYYQWLSPFSEGARQHIKNNITEVAEVPGLTSVHLDYVRYVDVILGDALQPKYNLIQETEMPEYDYGYHPDARNEFNELFGEDPMEMKMPWLSHEWRQFRMNAVTSLVNELAIIVHDHDKLLSAAVFPFPEMSRQMVRQDWSAWDLDIALPMLYHNFYNQDINWIGFSAEQGVKSSQGRFDLYAGLYLPSLTAGQLETAIEISLAAGANGISMFSMGGLSDQKLEVIKELSNKYNGTAD